MDDIWDIASRFLQNRMKTKNQLEKHLRMKEFTEEQISKVLTKFEEYGYINDVEYAYTYLSHCIPKGQTLWRMKRELSERGISGNDMESGLARYIQETGHNPKNDEFERGKIQAQKIIGDKIPVDSKLLAKAGRRLISLGYRSETVYAILGEFMKGKNQ